MRLEAWLRALGCSDVILVAGGGAAADVVAQMDRIHRLGEEKSHWLALEALGLTTSLLLALAAEGRPSFAVEDLCSFARRDDGRPGCLPHCWEVTSDSLAARVAEVVGARELVLLKSVTIPPELGWAEASRCGYVDGYFPTMIARGVKARCSTSGSGGRERLAEEIDQPEHAAGVDGQGAPAVPAGGAADGEPVGPQRSQQPQLIDAQRTGQRDRHARGSAAGHHLAELVHRQPVEQGRAVLAPGIDEECAPPPGGGERTDVAGRRGGGALPVGVGDGDRPAAGGSRAALAPSWPDQPGRSPQPARPHLTKASEKERLLSFPRSAWERTSATLCVASAIRRDAERPGVRSHAERGNERLVPVSDNSPIAALTGRRPATARNTAATVPASARPSEPRSAP